MLNSTQKLAFNNYKTFIETADCTREVFKDFVAVEDHVSRLLECIPGFTSACKQFSNDSQEINAKRRLNSLALSKHTQLLEVLEVPQVMETCVRNSYYEEALELKAHVRRLGRKHGHIAIVKAIVSDVEGSMELMLTQLLQQLRGSIQLPSCLKVVGFLKRMAVFSDTELRLRFLQARDAWLTGVLQAIPSDDAYHHITKTIEASRVHLFDIVTQYRAIFPDDDSVRAAVVGGNQTEAVEGALFYSWVNEKIWQFLHVLEADLTRGVGGRLDSLLGQCMYFGLSFSRIGADFRCLISPVFVRVIATSFRRALREAKHHFHDAMKHFTLLSALQELSSSLPHTALPPTTTLTPSLAPPPSLLHYPPLASLTNALIHAFNDLRQCAPLCLGPEAAQEISRLLESTVHDIGEFHRVEHASFSEKEFKAYHQLCRVIVTEFLPFVKRCFDNLFHDSSVEQLALTCPYALQQQQQQQQHRTQPPELIVAATLRGNTGGKPPWVKLRMELDVKRIGETLREVCPEVFSELEQQQQLVSLTELSSLLAAEEEGGGGGGRALDSAVEGEGVPSEPPVESELLSHGNAAASSHTVHLDTEIHTQLADDQAQ